MGALAGRGGQLGAIAALALSLAACRPVYGDAYLVAMASGERAYLAGRYDEAARAYDDAAAKALRVKDRDEARFLEARTFARAEHWAEATKAYQRLIAESKTGPRTERAAFDIAEIEIEHGDADRGWALLEQALMKSPNHGLARPSIRRILAHLVEKGGEPAALAWLAKNDAALAKTEQAQTMEYEKAVALEAEGKKDEAHDAYVDAAKHHPYPFGGLTDDAFMHAAQIDEDRGKYDEAIAHLRELLSSREHSDTVGSYERPKYPAAQMEIGLIYRDKLHDHAAARREFHRVFVDHRTSILADDALWDEALLARDDRDESAACALAATIAKELPDSRYAGCGKLVCSTSPEPKKPCHDYIVRAASSTP